jgi:hypothetical protein
MLTQLSYQKQHLKHCKPLLDVILHKKDVVPLYQDGQFGVYFGFPIAAHRFLWLGAFSQSSYLASFKNRELIATMTVLTDIRIAPTAGVSTIPNGYRMPAASGIATVL